MTCSTWSTLAYLFYTLSPRIVEVENGCIWKVTIGGTHFQLPWFWEEGCILATTLPPNENISHPKDGFQIKALPSFEKSETEVGVRIDTSHLLSCGGGKSQRRRSAVVKQSWNKHHHHETTWNPEVFYTLLLGAENEKGESVAFVDI